MPNLTNSHNTVIQQTSEIKKFVCHELINPKIWLIDKINLCIMNLNIIDTLNNKLQSIQSNCCLAPGDFIHKWFR